MVGTSATFRFHYSHYVERDTCSRAARDEQQNLIPAKRKSSFGVSTSVINTPCKFPLLPGSTKFQATEATFGIVQADVLPRLSLSGSLRRNNLAPMNPFHMWCPHRGIHSLYVTTSMCMLNLQIVPGRAGGGSFRRKKWYIARKEFAYRMCARRPTSAMPKSFLCCERAFCCSMVVM